MAKEAKGQNLWGLIVIAAILSGLSFWTYNEVANDYLSVERSNKMVAALLENQTQVVRNYAVQVNDFKNSLAQAEEKIAQVETENTDLKGKLASLSNVTALEQRIAELEASNAQLKSDMELAAATAKSREDELAMKLQEFIAELDFKSIDEGRTILTKYKKKIREIKTRIKAFQIEDRNEELASRKAQDAARLSLGNNGYLIRNGQGTPIDVAWPSAAPNKNVQIDVTFVK